MTLSAFVREARTAPQVAAGLVVGIAAALTLAGAWFFELALGLEPCPLCLDQRIPYYLALPLGILVAALARNPAHGTVARIGLAVIGLVMLAGAGLGVYHAGVEWGFWAGPPGCAGGPAGIVPSDILGSLRNAQRIVPCNEAAWRFLGVSLAGYNALIAGALAIVALWAASPRRGSV
jgi:disulfide bond formation protein DsbB